MSTSIAGAAPQLSVPAPKDMRVGIVTAQWNSHITHALEKGAVDTLLAAGTGAIELTFGASQLIESSQYDAVIVFGCVIRGDTPHFDYVCQSVTQGVTSLNADCDIPVIFGVLTVNNEQQALDRSVGTLGNKGVEAAEAAIAMVRFARSVK